MNILSIPSELSGYLTFFQNSFSKPQFERFSQHILGLITDPKYTSNRLSDNFFHKVNPSTNNRFLTESPWDNNKIETALYGLIESSSILPDYKIGMLDDTLSHKKYAQKMDCVGNHHDHLNDTFSNGHDLVSIGVHTKYGCLPLALKAYVKKKDLLPDMGFKTKNKIAEESILKIHQTIKLNLLTMDSWYGNNVDLLLFLVSLGIQYVAAIKSNRNITINHKKQWVREYYKRLNDDDFEMWTERKDGEDTRTFRLHKKNVFMSRLGSIDLLMSQQWDKKEEKWGEPWYIITNLKNKSAIQILCIYLKRSSIEGFHREAKQHLRLEAYKLRRYKGIVRHLFLVVIAYVFLILLMDNKKLNSTIGYMCNFVKKCCETVSFHTVIRLPRKLINHREVKENLGLVA